MKQAILGHVLGEIPMPDKPIDKPIRAVQLKDTVTELYKYCFFYKNECMYLSNSPEPCTVNTNGAICPNFKSWSITLQEKYKKKGKLPICWHDIVDWDAQRDTKHGTPFGQELQKTL